MSISQFAQLKRVFVIGSNLRKDHPLLAAKLRMAAKHGAHVSVLHATHDEQLMPIANKLVAAPSAWLSTLTEVMVAVAQAKNTALPAGFDKIEPSAEARQTAASLLSGEPRAILLGNAAANHPQLSELHAAAQWIAEATGATLGYLTEGANTVGGYLANALPTGEGNALQFFDQPRKAYVLLHAEPAFDVQDPQAARAALGQADMVVVMSPYQHGMEYADVLLPVSPFSETSGTFVNCEGRAQGFNGTVKPLGETRPAWKVLRVLGNLLGLQGFDYDTSEQIRNEVLGAATLAEVNLAAHLNNRTSFAPQHIEGGAGDQLERIGEVGIYSTDGIVRRAPSLQATHDAQAPKAWISPALAHRLGVEAGAALKVTQGSGSAMLAAGIDAGLPENVVRIATAHPSTEALGAMFGAIAVEKA
jgi:NADH-quinone oxidoreductase subunit G